MTNNLPTLLASDLEGVLIPEIWVAVAEKTGIEQLFLTTREISDYDQLMGIRLRTWPNIRFRWPISMPSLPPSTPCPVRSI